MNNTSVDRRSTLLGLLGLLLLWEIAGRMAWVADGALPAPSAVLMGLWRDRADYPAHVWGTVRTSAAGFLIGNTVAIAAGLLFVLWRPAGRIMAGVNITLFAMPAIAIVPILIIALDGDAPRIALAALSVYYPTMASTVLGLTRVDERLCDVVRVYGGTNWTIALLVRLRSGLPSILSGLRIAAPAAVLGSLLAEFGSGGSAGLGTYLIGSLGRADPARLWGIGLMATLISGAAYLCIDLVARRYAGNTLSASTPIGGVFGAPQRRGWQRLVPALAALMPLLFWWGCVLWFEAMGVSEVVLRTPVGVFQHLFLSEGSAETLQRLGGALMQTVPYAVLGMACGLLFAFVLAIVSTIWTALGRTLLPVSLITQSMPLVALTPLIVLIFGRDMSTILVVTVSVTFFPAFITIMQGLALVPASVQDLVRVYGGGRTKRLSLIALPWSIPYLCAAARIAAPRAFLGVMIAEWLATGTGVGNLLNESRGFLDYGMIWSVAAVAVLIAVALYLMVAALERRILLRYAMSAAD